MLLLAQIDVAFFASGVFLLLIGLRAIFQLPNVWRGEINFPVKAPPWWIWGQPLWSGFTRGMPSVVIFFTPGVAVILGFAIADEYLGLNRLTARLFGGVGGILCALGVVLASLVVLFNRPAALVVPSRRDELGAATTWFGNAMRRRAKRKSGDRNRD